MAQDPEMFTEFVKSKMGRAYEAADLSLRLTKDMGSRVALLSCYTGITRDRNNAEEVSLELSPNGRPYPIRMRKSDIFTVSEVFFGREYAIDSPLPRAPIIFDCGANIGISVIWFLAQQPEARVHAFEPEPENFRFLSANLGGREDVVLNQAAVAKQTGTLELHLAEHSAMHSVVDKSRGGRVVEVPAIRLSDYMRDKRIDRIDLLKLDVEGSELEAVEGLGSLIDNVGVIVGEIHEDLVQASDFYRFVEKRGFRRIKTRTLEANTHLFELARA